MLHWRPWLRPVASQRVRSPTVSGMAGERILVTGSAGHLCEALVRVLRAHGREVIGVDVLDSPFTTVIGSVSDRALVRECLTGARSVLHAATLHKPHVGTHDRQAFVDTNILGTLTLLEVSTSTAGWTSPTW